MPSQHDFNDTDPTQSYLTFAELAGCAPNSIPYNSSVFDCLVSSDSDTLLEASRNTLIQGPQGFSSFTPVTDGTLVQQSPSRQLAEKRINGKQILIGTSSNEGQSFTPQNINSEANLVDWLQKEFPKFSQKNIEAILKTYPSHEKPVRFGESVTTFCTDGYSEPTAIDMSCVASGQQQRANNILAEVTFLCPAYWLADAFSGHGRSAYKYQYSIPPGLHTQDLSAFFGPAAPNQGPDFVSAFQKIVGAFVISGNPSIPDEIANGPSCNDTTAPNPASNWPPYNIDAPYQLNLNQSGGTMTLLHLFEGDVMRLVGDSLRNNITSANATAWEGGRGLRCDFWQLMGSLIPE